MNEDIGKGVIAGLFDKFGRWASERPVKYRGNVGLPVDMPLLGKSAPVPVTAQAPAPVCEMCGATMSKLRPMRRTKFPLLPGKRRTYAKRKTTVCRNRDCVRFSGHGAVALAGETKRHAAGRARKRWRREHAGPRTWGVAAGRVVVS